MSTNAIIHRNLYQWAQHAGRPGHSFWPGLAAWLPAWWVRPCIAPSRLGNTLVVRLLGSKDRIKSIRN
jgi:hypothetical protein